MRRAPLLAADELARRCPAAATPSSTSRQIGPNPALPSRAISDSAVNARRAGWARGQTQAVRQGCASMLCHDCPPALRLCPAQRRHPRGPGQGAAGRADQAAQGSDRRNRQENRDQLPRQPCRGEPDHADPRCRRRWAARAADDFARHVELAVRRGLDRRHFVRRQYRCGGGLCDAARHDAHRRARPRADRSSRGPINPHWTKILWLSPDGTAVRHRRLNSTSSITFEARRTAPRCSRSTAANTGDVRERASGTPQPCILLPGSKPCCGGNERRLGPHLSRLSTSVLDAASTGCRPLFRRHRVRASRPSTRRPALVAAQLCRLRSAATSPRSGDLSTPPRRRRYQSASFIVRSRSGTAIFVVGL